MKMETWLKWRMTFFLLCLIAILAVFVICCLQFNKEDVMTTIVHPVAAAELAVDARPHIFMNGSHPTLRHSYYELHKREFVCKKDSYSCKECPVGPADRVITLSENDQHYDGVPLQINAWFACMDINTLVPESGSGVDNDQFICQREPVDGFVVMNGHKVPCSGSDAHKQSLGTINPGESKTVTIP